MVTSHFAFLDPFYEAVAWVLIHIHTVLGGVFGPGSGAAWALSIILLTALMKLLVVPLFIKQMKAQRKMMVLQPQVTALRKKYKNDKQTLNQEMMKLYQENGANPLMGCLPMVVQIPVWWALFDVLDAIAHGKAWYGFTPALVHSAQHASIFGATISTTIFTNYLPPYHFAPGPLSGKIVVIVAVLISGTMTYLTSHQMMKRGIGQMTTDPDAPGASMQKYMKYLTPVFALWGVAWPFGVVIYWVVSYTWQFGQTSILYRKYVTPVVTGDAGAEGSGTQAASATAQGLVKSGVSAQKDSAVKGTTANGTGAKGVVSRSTAAKTVPAKTPAARGTGAGTAGRTAPGRTAPGRNGAAAGAKGPGRIPAKPSGAGGSPAARSGAKPASAGKTPSGDTAARPSGAKSAAAAGGGQRAGGARRSQAPKGPQGSAKPGTDASRRSAAAGKGGGAAANGSAANGSGKRGLGRLVRSKPEPEPEPEAAAPKLVRQQRVRQPRSKRSGKR